MISTQQKPIHSYFLGVFQAKMSIKKESEWELFVISANVYREFQSSIRGTQREGKKKNI